MLKWECQGSNVYFLLLNGIYVGSKYVSKIDCLQSCPYNFFQSFSIEMPFLNLFGDWLVRLVIAACLLIDETCVLTWLFVSLHVMRGKSIYQRYATRLQAFNTQTVQKLARFKCLHILNRSKTRKIPWVPCKRKVDPCKFLSFQKFVPTRANFVFV